VSRAFFVEPDPVTLPLFDDGQYWISVKKELNAGEDKQLSQGAFTKLTRLSQDDSSPALSMDLEAAAFRKVLLYLLDWNVPDKAGKTVDITVSPKAKMDALKALKPAAFREIERVIDAHALSVEKNGPGGVPTPTATIS